MTSNSPHPTTSSATQSAVHVGVQLYAWNDAEQHRVLLDALAPLAREVRESGLADHFWYKSFDARGPHLLALFRTAETRASRLEGELRRSLGAYLERHPLRHGAPLEEIEERHRQCRGKALTPVDRRPGLEDDGSVVVFRQPPEAYPFHLTRDLAEADVFWQYMDGLTFRVLELLDRLGDEPATGAAITFVAAVDHALEGHRGEPDLHPSAIWRHHACTLLPALPERLRQEGDAAVVASLPGTLGERNRRVFDGVWARAEAGWPEIPSLVELAVADDGRTPERRRALLRELVHSTLIQLRQPVRSHVPMVLHAWLRRAAQASPVVADASRDTTKPAEVRS